MTNYKLDQRLTSLETKFEMFMDEMREMKRRQSELDAKMEAQRAEDKREFNAKIDKLDNKMDGISKHVQTMSTAVMVGIGAMIVSFAAITVTIVLTLVNK